MCYKVTCAWWEKIVKWDVKESIQRVSSECQKEKAEWLEVGEKDVEEEGKWVLLPLTFPRITPSSLPAFPECFSLFWSKWVQDLSISLVPKVCSTTGIGGGREVREEGENVVRGGAGGEEKGENVCTEGLWPERAPIPTHLVLEIGAEAPWRAEIP